MSTKTCISQCLSSRSLLIQSNHILKRQQERGISCGLVKETVEDGLVLQESGTRRVYLSDHAFVVLDVPSSTGITTFRHSLNQEWRAVKSIGKGGERIIDSSYIFHQSDTHCMFVGIDDKEVGGVELGFGLQRLGDSQDASYFEMVAVVCRPPGPHGRCLSLESFKMRFEPVLSRRARRYVVMDDVVALSERASDSSTRCFGQVKTVAAAIEGRETQDVPILRCLGAERGPGRIRTWLEYDYEEDSPISPSFSMKLLQQTLSKCAMPLPELSGRWRREEVSEYPGFSAYSIMAFPLGSRADGAVHCLVVVVQSNDEEEGSFEQLGIGRGIIGAPCDELIQVNLNMYRLRAEHIHDKKPKREVLSGNSYRLTRSSGEAIFRLSPVIPADNMVYTESDMATAQKLLNHFMPQHLSFSDAVLAGDVVRMAELLARSAKKGQKLEQKPIYAGSRWNCNVEPVMAAALNRRVAAAELLLSLRMESLDPFQLACVGSVSPRASKALMDLIVENPAWCHEKCPRGNQLARLGLTDCGLPTVAAVCNGWELARALASCGCDSDLFTAVLANDVEWVRALSTEDPELKNVNKFMPSWALGAQGLLPLMVAVQRQSLDMVVTLLVRNANPLKCRKGKKSSTFHNALVYDYNDKDGFPIISEFLRFAEVAALSNVAQPDQFCMCWHRTLLINSNYSIFVEPKLLV